MIECKSLTYRIGRRTILDGISLSARDGEITVILGKNGSGKTTLLRAITAPTEHRRNIDGTLLVSGDDAALMPPGILASRVSLLPQTLPIVACSVTELVSFAMLSDVSPFSHLSDEQRRTVSAAIDSVGLAPLADTPVSKLSGGERQLAYIAMMMARGADNLILDEPTASLDSRNRELLFAFLRRMRAEGRALLTVLHDINDAVAIADRIVILDLGRVIFDGTPSELHASGLPRTHFGLTPCMVERDGRTFTAYFS